VKNDRMLARTAGVLYLGIIILAGLAEGLVRGTLVVPGDAAATAQNILASEGLFRFGFIADLLAFISDAVIAVIFYYLFRDVDERLSMISAALRLIAHPAIAAVNLLNHLGALNVLQQDGGAFSTEQAQAQAMILLQTHAVGYDIAGAFFGVHCLLLGYLIVRSARFPSWIGILITIAAVTYLLDSFGTTLFPAYSETFAMIVVVPAVLAELSLCLFLLVRGLNDSHTMEARAA